MRLKRGGKRRFGRRCERGEELPRREGDEGAREEGCRAALGHRGSRCVFVYAERKVKITNETNETTFAVQGGSEEAALPSVLAPLLVRWQRGHRWGTDRRGWGRARTRVSLWEHHHAGRIARAPGSCLAQTRRGRVGVGNGL